MASKVARRDVGYRLSQRANSVRHWLAPYIALILIGCSRAPCGSASGRAERPVQSQKCHISTALQEDDFAGNLASRSGQNSPATASQRRPKMRFKQLIYWILSASYSGSMRLFPGNSPAARNFARPLRTQRAGQLGRAGCPQSQVAGEQGGAGQGQEI